MKQRRLVYYSAAQRAEIWDRWRRGVSMHDIGRRFDRSHSSIFSVLARTGGIRPPPRRRSRLALTLAEREEISRGLVAGRSLRSIAQVIGRSPSTLSREIGRNGGSGRYRSATADARAWKQALRPKPCKLAVHAQLRKARIGMVSSADRRLAEVDASGKRGALSVARDHLPEPLMYRPAAS
jgi:IS30 family transposase